MAKGMNKKDDKKKMKPKKAKMKDTGVMGARKKNDKDDCAY